MGGSIWGEIITMGNNKQASDVDICLKGAEVNQASCLKLKVILDEYPIPFFFDVLNYDDIRNKGLKVHIDTQGKLFYSRE